MTSIYAGAGYYMNDDRCSGGVKTEADVLTCSHCQKIIMKKPKPDGSISMHLNFCGCCAEMVCATCKEKSIKEGCQPFMKLIEEAATRLYRRKQFAELAGLEG